MVMCSRLQNLDGKEEQQVDNNKGIAITGLGPLQRTFQNKRMRIRSSNHLPLLINRMVRMRGYLVAPRPQHSNAVAPIRRERKLQRRWRCGPNFAAFCSCLRLSRPSCRLWGPIGISPTQQSAFRQNLGTRLSVYAQQSALRTWDIFSVRIQDELAWASGARCEFSSSFSLSLLEDDFSFKKITR